MGLVLDTDIIIRAERSDTPLDFSRWASYGNAYISAITVSELLIVVHRADSEPRRLRRSAFVEAVLARVPALPFTSEIARAHAEIVAALARKGAPIGAHDLIIASTAISHGYALLTFNVSEFGRVPGLELATF